jgi:hypothetical protein
MMCCQIRHRFIEKGDAPLDGAPHRCLRWRPPAANAGGLLSRPPRRTSGTCSTSKAGDHRDCSLVPSSARAALSTGNDTVEPPILPSEGRQPRHHPPPVDRAAVVACRQAHYTAPGSDTDKSPPRYYGAPERPHMHRDAKAFGERKASRACLGCPPAQPVGWRDRAQQRCQTAQAGRTAVDGAALIHLSPPRPTLRWGTGEVPIQVAPDDKMGGRGEPPPPAATPACGVRVASAAGSLTAEEAGTDGRELDAVGLVAGSRGPTGRDTRAAAYPTLARAASRAQQAVDS